MLMTANSFNEVYGVERATIDSWMHNRKEFIVEKNKHLYVDVNAYFNRIYSKQDLRLRAQDYYFYFTYAIGVCATFMTERLSKQFGGSIDTWNMFISYTIFNDMDNKRDSERLIKFLKWCEDDKQAYKYGAYMCVLGTGYTRGFLTRLREMV